MDLPEIIKLEEMAILPVANEDEPKGFASFMLPEQEEEPEGDKEEIALLDGPYVAPFVPQTLNFSYEKILSSLPPDLKVMVEPVQAEISTLVKSGVIQTKLSITLPSTENVEVIIDQYDTAPRAFHISFYGSEQTSNHITLKQNTLLTTLQAAFPNFSFAISPPFQKAPSFSLPKSKRFGYSPVNKGKSKK
jgi:hypothetical protein